MLESVISEIGICTDASPSVNETASIVLKIVGLTLNTGTYVLPPG